MKINIIRKHIAYALAMLAFSTMPVNVLAASSNSINYIDTVKIDDYVDNVNLTIEPKAGVGNDSSIILDIENAKFDFTMEEPAKFNIEQSNGLNLTWDIFQDALNEAEGTSEQQRFINTYNSLDYISYNTSELPYYIEAINDTEIRVFLAPLPDMAADANGVITVGKPQYIIPLKNIIATTDDEAIKVHIDSNGTTISSTTHTIAAPANLNSNTTTSVNKIATGIYSATIDDITIQGNLKPGTVIMKLNKGFRISDKNIVIEDTYSRYIAENIKVYDNYVEFDIIEQISTSLFEDTPRTSSGGGGGGGSGATTNKPYFKIKNLVIEPVNKGYDYGDVTLIIKSNENIVTYEKIKIAEFVYADGMEKSEGNTITYPDERTPYAVNGGNIYYDKNTGKIVDADDTISTITIPESIDGIKITAIGKGAFMNTNLITVSLPNSITEIGDYAFKSTKLVSLNIPTGIRYIGNGAFMSSNLQSFSIPLGVEYVPQDLFNDCIFLTEIKIPMGVKNISNSAFAGCTKLKNVELPLNVEKIEEHAFENCEIISISIPPTVKKIGYKAFENCPTTMIIYGAKDSYAEQYAQNNNLLFMVKDFSADSYTFGDADADDVITASDAAFVLQKTLISTFELPIQKKTDDWLKYVDVDDDTYVTASDAAFILQKTLISTFELPAEKKDK